MGVYENHKTNLNSARIHKWRALEYEEVMYTLVLLTDKCKQIPLGRLCPHTFPGWLYLYGVAAGDAPGCRRGDVCWACTSLDEPFPQQDTDKHCKPSRAIRAHKKIREDRKSKQGCWRGAYPCREFQDRWLRTTKIQIFQLSRTSDAIFRISSSKIILSSSY